MSPINFRQIHRKIALISILPLLITALTGVIYRLLRHWVGIPKPQISFLLAIHEGRYLGEILNPIYVLLEGLGLCILLVTGTVMLWKEIKSWFVGVTKSVETKKSVQEGD